MYKTKNIENWEDQSMQNVWMSYGMMSDTFGIPKSTLHKRIRIGPNLMYVGTSSQATYG